MTTEPTIPAPIVQKAVRAQYEYEQSGPDWEREGPAYKQVYRDGVIAALSAVYADIQAEAAAEALHAALHELEVTQSSHDVAECAAPVSGEVGRQDAIDAWITICEEPVEWMRQFAQRYAPEAPSDEYIREQMDEAWAEGWENGQAHGIAYQAGDDMAWTRPSSPYRADELDGGKP